MRPGTRRFGSFRQSFCLSSKNLNKPTQLGIFFLGPYTHIHFHLAISYRIDSPSQPFCERGVKRLLPLPSIWPLGVNLVGSTHNGEVQVESDHGIIHTHHTGQPAHTVAVWQPSATCPHISRMKPLNIWL